MDGYNGYNHNVARCAATAMGVDDHCQLQLPVLPTTKKGYPYLNSEWYWILIQLEPLLCQDMYAFKLTCTLIELLAIIYVLLFKVDLSSPAAEKRNIRDSYGYYGTLPPFTSFVQVLLRSNIKSTQNIIQHIYNINKRGPLKETLAHLVIDKQHAQQYINTKGNHADMVQYLKQVFNLQVSKHTAAGIFLRYQVGTARLDTTMARININAIQYAPDRDNYLNGVKSNVGNADAVSVD